MPNHSLIPFDQIVKAITEGGDLPLTAEERLLEAEVEKRKEEFVKKAMTRQFSREQALFLFELFDQLNEGQKLLLCQLF